MSDLNEKGEFLQAFHHAQVTLQFEKLVTPALQNLSVSFELSPALQNQLLMKGFCFCCFIMCRQIFLFAVHRL